MKRKASQTISRRWKYLGILELCNEWQCAKPLAQSFPPHRTNVTHGSRSMHNSPQMIYTPGTELQAPNSRSLQITHYLGMTNAMWVCWNLKGQPVSLGTLLLPTYFYFYPARVPSYTDMCTGYAARVRPRRSLEENLRPWEELELARVCYALPPRPSIACHQSLPMWHNRRRISR